MSQIKESALELIGKPPILKLNGYAKKAAAKGYRAILTLPDTMSVNALPSQYTVGRILNAVE